MNHISMLQNSRIKFLGLFLPIFYRNQLFVNLCQYFVKSPEKKSTDTMGSCRGLVAIASAW